MASHAAVRGLHDDLLRLYLDDVARHDLLTADEERRLGRLVVAGRVAQARLSGTGRAAHHRLGSSERARLEEAVREGRLAARRFVEANLRLVVSIAKHYRWSRLGLLDLVQTGNLGLMTAVQHFDPERGLRFSTYATVAIRMAIRREIVNAGHPIRLPVHVAQRVAELRRTADELELVLARAPSTGEVATRLGWSASEVEELERLPSDPASLDGGPGDRKVVEALGTSGVERDPLDVVSEDALVTRVDHMVDLLAEPDRTVLVLRYGLHGAEPCTWDELADRLHLPRDQVRRIERRAVRGLRRQGGAGPDVLAG